MSLPKRNLPKKNLTVQENPAPKKTLVIDGHSLTPEQVFEFMDNEHMQVSIAPKARERVVQSRRKIEQLLTEEGKPVYGVHTGLGKLKDFRVLESDQELFQRNILYSHAAGIGPCFEDAVVRLAMLLRANVFCRGNSGVRPDLIQRLLDFVNKGLYPQIPQIGSLGVGDLQPMAQLGLCLAGMDEGEIKYRNRVGSAPEILAQAGLMPVEFSFARREALALMSGSTVLLAVSVLALHRASKLVDHADISLSLSLEALRGVQEAYDERIQSVRNIEGQLKTARNVNILIENSEFLSEKARVCMEEHRPRVQDPVSFRSSPQVHGAVRDVLTYFHSIVERELNASTDNPLFFEREDGEYESLSGGNFHGALLSYGFDILGIVLTDLAVLSERRSARLLDPNMSYGLPCNLVADSVGLNTGFALVHANAAALIGEMRILAGPASIGSIPAKNNQEDHNSMGMGAARKSLQILHHLEAVLAIEMLCAAQGIDLVRKKAEMLRLGDGTTELHRIIRKTIPTVQGDRYSRDLILKMLTLIHQGILLTVLRERQSAKFHPLLAFPEV